MFIFYHRPESGLCDVFRNVNLMTTLLLLPLCHHMFSFTESKLQLQPVVRYKRQRDAELYVKLVHEFQLLQLKLYLMDLTAESLLPLLQNEHTDCR